MEYATHTWASVVDEFREHEAANSYFTPLRAFVEQVAASRYAAGLFPLKVMHTVRLFQRERAGDFDDEIRVDFEEGEFVVRYFSGGGPRPLWGPLPPGVWMKRGLDGFAVLERCLHHLRWFVDYTGAEAQPGSSVAPDAEPGTA